MTELVDVILGGTFHAAVLFLVAAGLQLVFGVQKIVNLACGSFYALGAYFGITLMGYAAAAGLSPWLIFPGLLVAGILIGLIGPPIERLLRYVYGRDESFQLLLTFALVLMFQDVFRFVWGSNPRSLDSTYLIYGTITSRDFSVPVYNLLVIAAAIAVAAGFGAFLQRTNYGRILRATAENRAMAEALGVNVRRVYSVVFTLGVVLALLPLAVPPYYAGLMIPFYGYAIALLGFNLLFGYTGLLSFGHAMFLGFGAYGAAVVAGVFGINSFEAVLVLVTLAAMAAALPIGFLCVRYVGIFFGMLTLAFGMLFHSFLFKFYYLTGGDSGMRVPRMNILGLEFAKYNKIELLAGPFYYYCLALVVIVGLLMWRIVHSPFGLHLKAVRDNARKAEYLGVHVRRCRLVAFVISAAYGAAGGAILGFRVGLADPELVYWTHSG